MVPLSGWDIAALVLSWMWQCLWSLNGADTATQARRENPRRGAADALLLSANVASLIAVGLVLVRAGHSNGLSKALLVGVSVASIVLAWSVVHTVYSLRYAKLCYQGTAGGVDFNADGAPRPAPRAAFQRVWDADHRDHDQPDRRADHVESSRSPTLGTSPQGGQPSVDGTWVAPMP
jgi:uncharacterized membrane protein